MRRQYSARPAFTLTEMLVATALILMIMAIISTAFRSGLDTFSKLNTTGKLQEQLVNAQRIIQRDLGADHFDETVPGLRGPRLSDQRMDRVRWDPPTNGYFIAWQQQTSPVDVTGLLDGENLSSSRNSKCFMRFTVKLRNDTPPYDIPMYRFAQSVTAQAADRNTYPDSILDPVDTGATKLYYLTATWGEVVYSMVQTGTTDGSVPVFSLRRTLANISATPPLSSSPNRLANDVPGGRISRAWDPTVPFVSTSGTLPAQISVTGDDILLTNVLSFELKYLWTGPTEFLPLVKKPVNPFQPNQALSGAGSPVVSRSGDIGDAGMNNIAAVPPLGDTSDWPFSDLPDDSSRTTMMSDGITRTTPDVAWPGAPNIPQDKATRFYFDTWYQPTSNAPVWTNPPIDDRLVTPGNTINPNATLPNQPPLRVRVKAIQFKLRIWDDKTGQSRQVTFMQEV